MSTSSSIAPIFIAAGPQVHTGDAALRLLSETNDSAYVIDGQGIPAVDTERWNVARRAEHTHWFHPGRSVADDRNFDHFRRFAGYESLRGRRFERALEIGCGPFTNLRLMADVCTVGSVSLLDPALGDYLHHRTAYYDRSRLYLPPVAPIVARVWSRSPSVGRTVLRTLRRTVPVHDLFTQGAEDAPSGAADLVVMINVIEHCLDATKVLASVADSVRPGGVLVLADKCYDPEVVQERAAFVYDEAHPLRVTEHAFRPILSTFRVLFHSAVLDRDVERYLPRTFEHYWILEKPT